MTTAFAELHRGPSPLLLPNAWDAASAAAFAAAGFPAVGTTSLGVASAAGLLDGSGAAREQTIALALALCGRSWMVSADIEGGFSDDPAAVADLCAALSEGGVAGVNIEDGRSDGSLRDAELHTAVVRAVKETVPDLFVNARTDTAWLKVGGLDETIRRVSAYADAGADGVFVPGLTEAGDLERVVAAAPVPLNALFSPSGPTVEELGSLGVARVSCGSYLFRVALEAAVAALDGVAKGADLSALPAMAYDDVQGLAS